MDMVILQRGFLSFLNPRSAIPFFFIAPEALNRYYLGGLRGEVGATWMTKEERLVEIKDYINYLDRLYISLALEEFAGTITALGFSQGASTVSRWADATAHRIDRVIIYAGDVAPELLPLQESSGLKRTENFFICGNRDNYFSLDRVMKMKADYKELNFTEMDFDGGHEIKTEVLSKLFV